MLKKFSFINIQYLRFRDDYIYHHCFFLNGLICVYRILTIFLTVKIKNQKKKKFAIFNKTEYRIFGLKN
jgi:hypothetical protein